MTPLPAGEIRSTSTVPTGARRRFAGMAAGVLVALAVVAGACGTSQTANRTITAALVDGGAGFTPDTITVKKTDNVKLTVDNSTDRTHGLSIIGYGVVEEVEAGKPLEVEFTASKSGTFEIKCQLHPAHKTATLVVE